MAVDVAEVLGDLHADVVVVGEQLQQLEPGEVEVVVLAAAHQVGVDASLHAVSSYSGDGGYARRAGRPARGGDATSWNVIDVVVLGTGAAGHDGRDRRPRGRGDGRPCSRRPTWSAARRPGRAARSWIPNNPHMGEVGVTDSREQAITYIMSLSRDMLEQRLVEAYVDAGPGDGRAAGGEDAGAVLRRARHAGLPPGVPRRQPRRRPDARVPDLPVRRARRVGGR